MRYLTSLGDQPLAKEPEDSGYEIAERVACVAVVSVSFKPSGASTKDAQGQKGAKKVERGGGGGNF